MHFEFKIINLLKYKFLLENMFKITNLCLNLEPFDKGFG